MWIGNVMLLVLNLAAGGMVGATGARAVSVPLSDDRRAVVHRHLRAQSQHVRSVACRALRRARIPADGRAASSRRRCCSGSCSVSRFMTTLNRALVFSNGDLTTFVTHPLSATLLDDRRRGVADDGAARRQAYARASRRRTTVTVTASVSMRSPYFATREAS